MRLGEVNFSFQCSHTIKWQSQDLYPVFSVSKANALSASAAFGSVFWYAVMWLCVYVCERVLGGILGGVPPLCFVSFSCLTNLPTRWGSSYQDRVCSMAKNTMCSEISTKGEGSVAFFFFFTTFMLLSMAIIVQVFESHLFFSCVTFSPFS